MSAVAKKSKTASVASWIASAEANVAAVSAMLVGAAEVVAEQLPPGTAKSIVQAIIPLLVMFGRGSAKHIITQRRLTRSP